MLKTSESLFMIHNMPDWVTIQEAVDITTEAIKQKTIKQKITPGDIYRYALSGNILLSVYFQSPVILKKIQTFNGKIKFRKFDGGLLDKLCMLDRNGFIDEKNLILCTEGKYIFPVQQIIDTTLMGYEYVLIQRILARELHFPSPVTGAKETSYGITVKLSGSLFQVFEKMTWKKRAENQIALLPENTAPDLMSQLTEATVFRYRHNGYFPLHELPSDACFVIRHTEVEKLINLYIKKESHPISPPRMTTPLSRLFWLACRHNDAISPLLNHPYKLLSIFEQWASDDGIREKLDAETLKNALKRGAPSVTSPSG
ncbi:hypothetical protein RC180_003444 [Salmonella enterica]|nr:hypothetical protein [Salmonella enterica]